VPILLALERLVRNPRSLLPDRWWWISAFGLCALHPAFYLWRLGRLTPLVPHNDLRIPAIRTLLAVLSDSNIGLVPNAPFTALVLVSAGVAAATDRFRRKRLVFAALIAAAFLIAFAQAPNINSGGTVDVSRYALWLIPLVIVVWPRAWSSRAQALAMGVLVGASVIWAGLYFRPSIDERYLAPTRLAMWLWTKQPSWENPLPEIFAERLRHQDGVNPLAATPGCEKALIQEGHWPEGCAPVRAPAVCLEAEALCYANRTGDGRYSFVPTNRRGGILLRN